MSKKEPWLVFVDTNIMLDFYRLGGESAERQIQGLQRHMNSVIVTEQVKMEFMKNRQKVIVDAIGKLAAPPSKAQLPAIVSASQPALTLSKRLKEASDAHRKIHENVENILREPSRFDPVFKGLKKIFNQESDFNLKRPNPLRFTIRNRARKRFALGYPPRKASDNSIGDALNWEWIIHCAELSQNNANVLIVSRDSDYGAQYRGSMILNDWLNEEFKKRVSQRRKIKLTNRLTDALKIMDEAVSAEDEAAEDELIKNSLSSFMEAWLDNSNVSIDKREWAEFLEKNRHTFRAEND